MTESPIPTEKISSPKHSNVFDVIISALTSKEFLDSKVKMAWRVGIELPHRGSIRMTYLIQYLGLLSYIMSFSFKINI